MVRITSRATAHLLELRRRRGFDDAYGARLSRSPETRRVALSFVRGPEPTDRLLPQERLGVYLDQSLHRALRDATIDAVETDGSVRLKIGHRPH